MVVQQTADRRLGHAVGRKRRAPSSRPSTAPGAAGRQGCLATQSCHDCGRRCHQAHSLRSPERPMPAQVRPHPVACAPSRSRCPFCSTLVRKVGALMVSNTLHATWHTSGLPANVEPWSPGGATGGRERPGRLGQAHGVCRTNCTMNP